MFLGIDIGTSGVKAVLWDGETVQATGTVELTTQVPFPGASEQTPDAWWRAVVSACHQMQDTPGWSSIRAIGLSGQMHGLVCLDEQGRVVRPAILWNDNRAEAESRAMAEALPDVGACCGVPPMPGFPAPKMAWLRRHAPEDHRATVMVLQTKDWIGYRLHGRYVSEMSEAAGTLWLDQGARDWDDAALAFSGLDRKKVPELAEGTTWAGDLTGSAAAALGLPAGLPVIRGGGDAMAGAVGVGVVGAGRGLISLGTSGQILLSGEVHRPAPAQFIHSFAHCVPGQYIQMAAMLNGAAPMAWLSRILGQPVPALLDMAATADARHVPLFLPYLTGERTPLADPTARAGFQGIGHETGPAEMMRAVVDAIAYSCADGQTALLAAGCEVPPLLAIGGGARSDLVLQTVADVLGIEVLRPADAALGPALGAAKLAAVGAGAMPEDTLSAPPEIGVRFAPRPESAVRHVPRLDRFRALYRTLRVVCARP